MELTRRFIFRGNAAAAGGHVVRPQDVVIHPSCAASLPVTGGRSGSSLEATNFGDVLRFGGARTFAQGLFDDREQAIEHSHGHIGQHMLTATTTVTAEVTDLVIGSKPALTARAVRGTHVSTSPAGSNEASFRLADETVFDGIAVDGHPLIVEVHHAVFQRYDTRAKLVAAADDPQFVNDHGACFFMKTALAGRPVPPRGRLVEERGVIHATVVRSIQWDGPEYPGAVIDHHTVRVPNFGVIFFGEILITESSRRLTMIRVKLGSPCGGDISVCDLCGNGIWS